MKHLASLAWLCCTLLGACGGTSVRTEVLVVVDSDLKVPQALDELVFRVQGPSGGERVTSAPLAAGAQTLPRSLALVHEGGALSPLVVRVQGMKEAQLVLERQATLHFVRGRTLVLPMHLVAACVGVACGADTCSEQGCVSAEIDPSTLASWNGQEPRLGDGSAMPDGGSPPHPDAGSSGAHDAGHAMQSDAGTMSADSGTHDAGGDGVSDAGQTDSDSGMQCVPQTELCNGLDDDCDGKADNGFDLLGDEQNCGQCGNHCNVGPNRTCCSGTCKKICQ
jgi:hypothetical protein